MSNMSYCRFRNTLADLRDCEEYMDETLGDEETRARRKMIDLMANMLRSVGYGVEEPAS